MQEIARKSADTKMPAIKCSAHRSKEVLNLFWSMEQNFQQALCLAKY
jgi:hypothetical protein